jgi:8-oxo-dGTP pyrophosphatase MutT (NUDIX family)
MKNLLPGVYESKPKEFVEDIISTASIIKFNKKILFLKKAINQWSENLWGIPCGRLEAFEDIYLAMLREIKEEIGYDLHRSTLKYLGKLFIVQNDLRKNIHNVFYFELKELISIELSAEHSDYRWLDEKDISGFDLIPNQLKVLEFFKAYHLLF